MKKRMADQNCGNCRKRGERSCGVFKVENKRPQDDEWCSSYGKIKEEK